MSSTVETSTGRAPVGGAAGGCVRLLVVDDHPVVRSGLAGMLGSASDIDVVGQAADGAAAVALAAELVPDVILMDLRMPVLDGVEATRRITAGAGTAHSAAGAGTMHGAAGAGRAAPRVVVLTTYDSDEDILPAVEAGAIGYLLKDSHRRDILAAVRAAHEGRSVLSPAVTARLVRAARNGDGTADGGGDGAGAQATADLSPREREILAAVSRGLPNSAIASELYITEATVKTYLKRAFRKLGVESRAAAVARAIRLGALDLD